MSRNIQPKRKELIKLDVVNADEVWIHNNDNTKHSLRKDIEIFGKVEKGTSAFITSTNLRGSNHRFVDDTHNLSKKTKQEITKKLLNENRKVVYLVKRKK